MDGVPGRENFDEQGHHGNIKQNTLIMAMSRIGDMPHKKP
jgi:hypothetical protein